MTFQDAKSRRRFKQKNKIFWSHCVTENSVVFNFSTNIRAYSLTLVSVSALNTGRWQHVVIEFDSLQARLTLNLGHQWVQFGADERIVAYHGTMYLGGATP